MKNTTRQWTPDEQDRINRRRNDPAWELATEAEMATMSETEEADWKHENETIDQGVGMIRDKLRELGLSDQMKLRYSNLLGEMTPDYPPTYGGMVEHLRDDPSTENYRFFTTVVRRSHTLTRQGRANVLRDLRDAMRQ